MVNGERKEKREQKELEVNTVWGTVTQREKGKEEASVLFVICASYLRPGETKFVLVYFVFCASPFWDIRPGVHGLHLPKMLGLFAVNEPCLLPSPKQLVRSVRVRSTGA